MAGFKQPDFMQRQEAAAKARKVAFEKYRAKIADPALAERLTERAARATERGAIKATREIERAEKKARQAERAERDAAIEAERVKAESVAPDQSGALFLSTSLGVFYSKEAAMRIREAEIFRLDHLVGRQRLCCRLRGC